MKEVLLCPFHSYQNQGSEGLKKQQQRTLLRLTLLVAVNLGFKLRAAQPRSPSSLLSIPPGNSGTSSLRNAVATRQPLSPLPLLFSKYDLRTLGVNGDLSGPTTLRLSLTSNSGPSNKAPTSLSNFLSAYKPQLLLHMVCPSVSLRFTAPLTGTKHLLLFFFWLKVVTSHHSRACQSPKLQVHTSASSPWDLVFLSTTTKTHHSPLFTICLFFKATEKELGGRKVRISLS